MKKIISITFVLLCLFPLQSFAFSDIDKNGHRNNIEKLAKLNILQGYEDGTFRPNEPVTRGQAVIALTRLYEQIDLSTYRLWAQHKNKPIRTYRTAESVPLFKDVQYAFGQKDNIELVTSAEQLYSLGVINGYNDGTLRPNESLKRIHIATMLQKLFLFPSENNPVPFTDIKNEENRLPVANLYAYNITTGSTATTFSPNKTLTRGQFASFLARTMDFLDLLVVDVPVKKYSSKELEYVSEFDGTVKSIIITSNNAEQYSVTRQQLQQHQYVAYQHVIGSGCRYEIAGVTQVEDALHIDFMESVQVIESIYACTASIHYIEDIFKFDLDVNLQRVTINGEPLLRESY
ncbi:MAG: S-layer homology domain-containing protein [Lysinibacillus sp.]